MSGVKSRNVVALASTLLLATSTNLVAGPVNPANMNTLVPGAPAVAAEVNANFSEHTTQINDNDGRITALESAGGSGAADTFIHWGSSQAPAGSTLLYSGFGFGSHYTHAGSISPVVIKAYEGAAAPATASDGILYPLSTWNSPRPPGIPFSYIKAAMCSVDSPVTVVWGTQNAPAGTTELYKGYAMGPYYGHQGPSDMICVDSVNFESAGTPASPGAVVYGMEIGVVPSADYTLDVYLECVVVKAD